MKVRKSFGDDAVTPWTLAQIYADLQTTGEIARNLNVKEARIATWVARRDEILSPLPIRRCGRYDLYSFQEWQDWYQRWLALHEKQNRVINAPPHPSGEQFWSYFRDCHSKQYDT